MNIRRTRTTDRQNKMHSMDTQVLRRELDIFKERYDRDQNPIWLMQAFLTADKYRLPMPEWVQNGLRDAFQRYLDSEQDITLDRAFGLTVGRGETPPRKAYRLRSTDVRLYSAIELLVREGMTVIDAVSVVHDYFPSLNPVNKGTMRLTYYEWKTVFAKVKVFAKDEIGKLLYSAPDTIRNKQKYKQLFSTYAPFRPVPPALQEFLIKHGLLEDLKYLERTPAADLPTLPA